MLPDNISVENGLANKSTGTVRNVVWPGTDMIADLAEPAWMPETNQEIPRTEALVVG
jgi:hypothetical protein